MKKIFIIVVIALLTVSIVAGCSPVTKVDEPTETKTQAVDTPDVSAEVSEGASNAYGLAPGAMIGMSMTDKSEQRWVMDGDSMRAALEEKGYTLDLQYANMEPQTQIAQIENMILTGCKAIVVVPVDSGSLGEVLAKAKESNILIINYDLMALNTPDIDYYIGFDNKQVGMIQAEYIVDKLELKNGKGPFNMEIFAGSLDEVNAYWYYEEAMKILQPYIDNGQLVVKSGQTALETVTIPAWAAETTSARMENLVTTYYSDGTPLDVVLAPADSIGVPIGNTLKSIGYGTPDKPMPIITGNNGNTSAIQSIINGQMSMSIFKDTRNLAKRTAEVIDSIANGIELVPDDTETFDNGVIKIPAFLYGMEVIDANNWRALALDSGYYSAEQLGVK